MKYSDLAPALGLIRRSTHAQTRIDKGLRETRDLSDLIWCWAIRECMTLDDLWTQRNPTGSSFLRKGVHRNLLDEYAAFYVCITERFLRCCVFQNPITFMDAVADEVREAALSDPWLLRPPRVIADLVGKRAMRIHHRVECLRLRYGDPSASPVEALIAEAAQMIAFRFFAGSRSDHGMEQSIAVFADGLNWTSRRFLKSAAFYGLVTRGEFLFLPP